MATLPLKASRKEQHSVIHFLWAKRRCRNMRCVQYMVTSVLYDQQYMFGVRSLLVDEKALLIKKRSGRCVVSTTDPAITAVASLIRSDRHVSISVQIFLDNMLKNKRLMFDI